MLLTTALLYNAMRQVWRWPIAIALSASGIFLLTDLAFFAANLLKLPEGGWIPLLLGALIFVVMTTWHRGIEAIRDAMQRNKADAQLLISQMTNGGIARVSGTAVFLSRGETPISQLMVRHVAQIKALQETVVSLTVHFEEVPRVPLSERAQVSQMAPDLWHVAIRFGFIEVPNVAAALLCALEQGCPLNLEDAVYFAARDEVVQAKARTRLAGWRRILFGFMYRNAVHASDRFDLPPDKLLEIGRQIAL